MSRLGLMVFLDEENRVIEYEVGRDYEGFRPWSKLYSGDDLKEASRVWLRQVVWLSLSSPQRREET